MIVFCEDCGHKNDLDLSDLAMGRADFTCVCCGYANSFPVSMKENSLSAGTVLNNLLAFPHIIGAFFYHRTKGVQVHQTPGSLIVDDLWYLGTCLLDSFEQGASSVNGIQSMTVVIANKYIQVHRAGKYGYLVVISKNDPLSDALFSDALSRCLAALDQGGQNG